MKQLQPFTITGGQVVTPAGVIAGAVRCAGGMIVAVGADVAPEAGDAVIAAKGQLVAPGLVDLGVFAIDKPAFHFGGITRAALMPDQSPPLDYPSRINFIAKSGKPDLWVHPLAAATRALEGQQLAEIALMKEAGARGIATGRRWIADSGVMLRLLQYAAMLDLVVVTHAEDAALVGEAAATAGEIATRLGLFAQWVHLLAPKLSEVIMSTAYGMFPESPAATGSAPGAVPPPKPTPEAITFAKVMRGLHW